MQISAPAKRASVQVRPLSQDLLEDYTTYIEEGLYTQAFTALYNTLTADTELSSPVYIAPPQHISLSATLSVHPAFTTRTFAEDKKAASKAALNYFRNVARLAHLKDVRVTKALRFTANVQGSDRSQRAMSRRSDMQVAGSDEGRSIRVPYAHQQSLFSVAEDFWSVIGWTFNCSVRHKLRWNVWRTWLEAMLDALQLDIEHSELMEGNDRDFSETLLHSYIASAGQGRNIRRRLMRAIFADGSAKSCGEFPELWRNETSPPKQKSDAHYDKRRRLDIENNEYCDYLDDDSADETSGSTTQQPRSSKKSNKARLDCMQPVEVDYQTESEIEVTRRLPATQDTNTLSSIDDFGGIASVRLRQRLLSLLVILSREAPMLFVDFDDLFALFTEFIRPLPLGVFQQLVLPATPYLPTDAQILLNEMLSRPLIAAHAPMNTALTLSPAMFEMCYAPFAAFSSSAVENAKCSLLVESMMRELLRRQFAQLEWSTFVAAVEKGIEARKSKVAEDGRRKTFKNGVEIEARCVLDTSAVRMKSLLATHRDR